MRCDNAPDPHDVQQRAAIGEALEQHGAEVVEVHGCGGQPGHGQAGDRVQQDRAGQLLLARLAQLSHEANQSLHVQLVGSIVKQPKITPIIGANCLFESSRFFIFISF